MPDEDTSDILTSIASLLTICQESISGRFISSTDISSDPS